MKKRFLGLAASLSASLMATGCGPALLGSLGGGSDGATGETGVPVTDPAVPIGPTGPTGDASAVVERDANEPNDTIADATDLGDVRPGDSIVLQATIDDADEGDFFVVNVVEGIEFDFVLTPDFPLDLGIAGLFADGTPFSAGAVNETIDDLFGGGVEAGSGVTDAGIRIFRITASDRDPDGTGSYQLSLTFRAPEVDSPVVPPGFENAIDLGLLAVGDSLLELGTLPPPPTVDQFRVELTESATVSIEVFPFGTSDVAFEVFDATGTLTNTVDLDPAGVFGPEFLEASFPAGALFIEVVGLFPDPFEPAYELILTSIAPAALAAPAPDPRGELASLVSDAPNGPPAGGPTDASRQLRSALDRARIDKHEAAGHLPGPMVLVGSDNHAVDSGSSAAGTDLDVDASAPSGVLLIDGVATAAPQHYRLDFGADSLLAIEVLAQASDAISVTATFAPAAASLDDEYAPSPIQLDTGAPTRVSRGALTLAVRAAPEAIADPFRLVLRSTAVASEAPTEAADLHEFWFQMVAVDPETGDLVEVQGFLR